MEFVNAFFVGGLICALAQLLIDKTKLTPARILVLFELAGFVLGIFKIYDKLVEFAGAGASIPISGFGNILVKGVLKALEKDDFYAIFSGGMSGAAAGMGSVIFFAFLAAIIFRSNDRE